MAGDLINVEALYAASKLSEYLGECKSPWRFRYQLLALNGRSFYVGNGKIEDIDNVKNIILLGTNPRKEASVVNARIRKAWIKWCKCISVGSSRKFNL